MTQPQDSIEQALANLGHGAKRRLYGQFFSAYLVALSNSQDLQADDDDRSRTLKLADDYRKTLLQLAKIFGFSSRTRKKIEASTFLDLAVTRLAVELMLQRLPAAKAA